MTRRTDGPGGEGVIVTCEREGDDRIGRLVRCLWCGKPFALRRAAITVWAMGEEIGFSGPCCLRVAARSRFEQKVREFERAGTEEPR